MNYNLGLKIAVIGGGYWGKNLIREFNNLKSLHTICDINKEALEHYNKIYPNVKTTTDYNTILENSDIDAVCIALPANMHYKISKESLNANKHVFVEKPITLDIKHAEELLLLSKEKSKILMVGHLLHYHPCIIKIKEMIKDGKIGKIQKIISNRLNLGKIRIEENVLWSFAPHDISIILSLCNNKMPNSIHSSGSYIITKNIYDVVNSVFKYDDIYVNINVNWLNPYKEQKISIIGDKGIILFDDTSKDNKLIYIDKYIEYDSLNNPSAITNNYHVINDIDLNKSPLLRECEHFINCCNSGEQPITNGEEALRVLKMLTIMQESLNTKTIQYINEKKTNINYFLHHTSTIDKGAVIGEGCKIWHYSHICKTAKIGKYCNIGQNVYIGDGVILGDYCKVQNNVSIYNGVTAGDYVFFGPSCVLTNDLIPRCKYSKNGNYIKTIIEDGVTLGANCTIVCGNTLGKDSLIGAGCVINKNVEKNSVMVGNPGKKIGLIDEYGNIIYF